MNSRICSAVGDSGSAAWRLAASAVASAACCALIVARSSSDSGIIVTTQKMPMPHVGRAPAVGGDEVLRHRRPDGAAEIIAGRGNRHRDAAAAPEPVRDVGHQRRKSRRGAEADQRAVRDRRLPQAAGLANDDVAGADEQGADHHGERGAETIGEPAGENAAAGEAEHGQRIGHRCCGAVDAEFGLHRRQRHHHRPHADAADGRQRHRHGKPQPGHGGIGRRRGGGAWVECGHDDGPGLSAMVVAPPGRAIHSRCAYEADQIY